MSVSARRLAEVMMEAAEALCPGVVCIAIAFEPSDVSRCTIGAYGISEELTIEVLRLQAEQLVQKLREQP